VTVGRGLTVSVAVVSAEPPLFVKWARYLLLLSAAVVVNVSGEDVAPTMLLNVAPPSVETCHCRLGAGAPPAAALNETLAPSHTV
jgi:hypothetical protein